MYILCLCLTPPLLGWSLCFHKRRNMSVSHPRLANIKLSLNGRVRIMSTREGSISLPLSTDRQVFTLSMQAPLFQDDLSVSVEVVVN